MVIIMDANTGKVIREPEDYDDEVLNAGWLPQPSLQLEQVEHAEHAEAPQVPPGDIDAFLRAMYEHQE